MVRFCYWLSSLLQSRVFGNYASRKAVVSENPVLRAVRIRRMILGHGISDPLQEQILFGEESAIRWADDLTKTVVPGSRYTPTIEIFAALGC
jgi:hypothetical protein